MRCWMIRRSSHRLCRSFDPRGGPALDTDGDLSAVDVLEVRYRLGYESLCREAADSITWRRFCRIGLDGSVPHPTTLMKLTTRCGSAAVDGLNEALLVKAAEAKLQRITRIRVDTTVVAANVAATTDSGLLARAIRRIAATGERIQAAGRLRDRSRAARWRAQLVETVHRSCWPPLWFGAVSFTSTTRSGRVGERQSVRR